jgi:hypothetical protein
VHRQTAASVVQHLSLGVAGLSCEDALTHLLNYVWPNVFEDSPHLINGVMGAIDGCRLALGPCAVLQYTLQVRGGACVLSRRGAGPRREWRRQRVPQHSRWGVACCGAINWRSNTHAHTHAHAP